MLSNQKVVEHAINMSINLIQEENQGKHKGEENLGKPKM